MNNEIKVKKWPYIVSRGLAFFLGLVFLLAAFSKFGDLASFQKALINYTYIPSWLQGLALIFIPGIELAIGVCLIAGLHQKEAAFIAVILLLWFVCLGIYDDLTASVSHPCGCFKLQLPTWVGFEMTGGWTLVRNVALTAFALITFIWNQQSITAPILRNSKT